MSLHEGQTSICKKVYSATPISEGWTTNQIMQELMRLGISSYHKMVAGCLDSLRRSGLVMESEPGKFSRVPVKAKLPDAPLIKPVQVVQQTEEIQMALVTKVTPQSTPIDKLTKLSSRCTAMMSSLKALAEDIDHAALEIEEQFAASAGDTIKLRQLQALLKGL